MRIFKVLLILSTILLCVSCGMNWENGGDEEFMTNCSGYFDGEMLENENASSYDKDATCNCLLEKAKSKHDNYEDYLMSDESATFVFDHFEKCLKEK